MPSSHSVSAEIVELGYDLAPKSAVLELDETHRPYGEVVLTCPLPPLATSEDIEPRAQRVVVVQSLEEPGRWEEVPPHLGSVVRRNLARDPETTATTEWAGNSGTVLSVVGGYLRSTATGTAAATANARLASGSSTSAVGSAAANDPFALQVKIKRTGSAQYVRLRLGYTDAAGVELGSFGMSPTVQTVPAGSGDYTLTLVGVLPNNVSISRITAAVYFYSSAASANPTAGQVNEFTDFLVDVGSLAPLTTGDVTYFAGSTTDDTTAGGFVYDWAGTANASASTQTVLVASDPVWVVDRVEREWDLLLHEVSFDHASAEMTIVARTDEALLIDGGNDTATPDYTPSKYEGDLRQIVNAYLATYGTALQVDTVTATIRWNATNLCTNPSAETNTTGWTATNATLSRVNSGGAVRAGSWMFSLSAPVTNDSYMQFALTTVVGRVYTVTAAGSIVTALTGAAHARARAISVLDGATQIGISSPITNASLAVGVRTVTFTATSTATSIRLYHGHTGGTMFWDGITITEGPLIPSYFDGATGAGYTTAWTGTAHNSTSTRTATNAASTDALIQEPGQTDWDVLAPLVEQAGLRLWCDEQRRWWLTEDDHTVDGTVYISSGFNATREVEHRAVAGVIFETVVVKYTWTDTAGVSRVAYDVAGSGAPIRLMERPTPFPGPGAAAAILARDQARGRVLDLEALADPLATPTQALNAVLPGIPTQHGLVASVTWNYPADEMTITSRDLLETPVGAIDLLAGTIDSLAGTINSL